MQGQHSTASTSNFYRRKLPSSCIDFSSVEGKKLFTESLLKGHANVYFRLASQFLTQDEPAYCGISTLVMVLNALDVDPGRVWKSPWRFYHESMLDCCLSLDEVKRTGITLPQFTCLAECNKLCTELRYAETTSEFLSTMRETLKRSVAGEDMIFVVSYNRQVLDQTGTGHFSPLGAYHEESDQVLIMDVARFKYPPHWVPLSVVRDAMLSVDTATGKSRGYLTLKLRPQVRPLVLFSLQPDIDAYKTQFAPRLKQWEDFLAEKVLDDTESEFKAVCAMLTALFEDYVACCDCSQAFQEFPCESHKAGAGKNCCEGEMKEEGCCRKICLKVLSLSMAKYISSAGLCAFLLAWPLQETSERSTLLKARLAGELRKLDEKSLADVMSLRQQIEQISIACKSDMPPAGQ